MFAYDRLVSTQWQTGGAPQGTPANVVNIVIESYVQDVATKPAAAHALPVSVLPPGHPSLGATPPSGCLGCHIKCHGGGRHGSHRSHFLFWEAQ